MSSSHPTRLVGTYALCFKTSAQSSSLTTHATGVLLAKMAHAPTQWFLAETNSSTVHPCSNVVVGTHADINSSHAEINSSPVRADECHADKGEVSPCSCKYKFLHAEINPRQFMHMHAMQIEVKSHFVTGTVPASASNLSVSPFTSSLQMQPPQ